VFLKLPLVSLIRLARRYEAVNALALYCLRWTPGLKARLRCLGSANQTSNSPFLPSASLHDMSPRGRQFHAMLHAAFDAKSRQEKA